MRLETRKYLEDMRQAAEMIGEFIAGKTWNDYTQNSLLRSGVERQFEILGEALNQLRKADPETAGRINQYRRIINFRNILIHGYAYVEDQVVWEIAEKELPILIGDVMTLLNE